MVPVDILLGCIRAASTGQPYPMKRSLCRRSGLSHRDLSAMFELCLVHPISRAPRHGKGLKISVAPSHRIWERLCNHQHERSDCTPTMMPVEYALCLGMQCAIHRAVLCKRRKPANVHLPAIRNITAAIAAAGDGGCPRSWNRATGV